MSVRVTLFVFPGTGFRVSLMARTVDCIEWKPEDQLGGEFLKVDTDLHPNNVQSVKISTELPNLDVSLMQPPRAPSRVPPSSLPLSIQRLQLSSKGF